LFIHNSGEEVASVQPDGTMKAVQKMLRDGVLDEAQPMFTDKLDESKHHKTEPAFPPKDLVTGNSDFKDVNYSITGAMNIHHWLWWITVHRACDPTGVWFAYSSWV